MKSKVEYKNINNLIATYKETLSRNLRRIMNERELTQKALAELAVSFKHSISQGTISGILNKTTNPGLEQVITLASVLDVTIDDLLSSSSDDELCSEIFQPGESFIKDPESSYMKPYLGDFNVVFFKTSGNAENEEKLVYGLLKLGCHKDNKKTAELRIFLDEQKQVYKEYMGYFYISPDINTAYLLFVSDKYHEISLITFHYIYTNQEKIDNIVAAALTTASGSNRYPTMHRMIFSRTTFSSKDLVPLKGQLRMNDMNIYLTREQIVNLCNETDISSTLKNSLRRALSLDKHKCFCIPENKFEVGDEMENERNISIIRSQSKAPKYNKIGSQTSDTVFHLLDKSHKNNS